MPTRISKPRAAPTGNLQALGGSIFGPNLEAGKYEVRLIKGKETFTSSFELAYDTNAPYSIADREKQREITMNLYEMSEKLGIEQNEDGLLILFPENLDPQKITGKVFLYRTSNKKLDFEMPISISNNQMLIPNNKLLEGRWNLKVDWKYLDNAYLYKKEIMY